MNNCEVKIKKNLERTGFHILDNITIGKISRTRNVIYLRNVLSLKCPMYKMSRL